MSVITKKNCFRVSASYNGYAPQWETVHGDPG